MTYLEIPQAARETGANAIKGTWTLFETCPELAQEVTDLVLSTALPHLLAEVKVLTEEACMVAAEAGRLIGRKEAGEEIAEHFMADARRFEDDRGNYVIAQYYAMVAREISSQPPSATSDAISGAPEQQEVSEAARSPQEPCGHPTCPCASREAR